MKLNDFDQIYVIHLAGQWDRYNNIVNEFTRMGLMDKLYIKYVASHPKLFEKIVELFPETDRGNYKGNIHTRARAFSVTWSHYEIIKSAYELGYNHIMIFEDDIQFNCDRDVFEKILEYLPDYYEVGILGWTGCMNPNKIRFDVDDNTNVFVMNTAPEFNAGAYAYCLSRRGMERILNILDDQFPVIDMIFNKGIWPYTYVRDIDTGKDKLVAEGFFVINYIPIIVHGDLKSTINVDT